DPQRLEQRIQNLENMPGITEDFRLSEIERLQIKQIRWDDLQKVQRMSLYALIPITLISFITGFYVSGRFLYPIQHLAAQMQKLRIEELGKTLPEQGSDEIDSLIHSFNDLSQRLKKSFNAQLKFVLNASHELKTPLTIIHTNLDIALQDHTATEIELRQAIQQSLDGVKRIENLTNNLLDLVTPIKMDEIVDVTELILEQIEQLQEFAKQHSVQIVHIIPKKRICVRAHSFALGRAVYNIIENAIKYSASVAHPKVCVTISDEEVGVHVSIEDNGIGIPEYQQNFIFDRFFSAHRQNDTQFSHSTGLGLAIAKDFIEEHRGELKLLSSKKGKTIFQISLYS
ncbi:MAG TPA: HAMP domain-containing sensor histidine kinase, partial [Patescibacteria group bacterium]|nr:HAMP domain-containing sensor histidine kinase [Patescibacteria group bacterium]